MSDIIRVLRLVQIVGPRDLVEEQVNKSLHGTKVIQRRDMRQLSITSITIGEFPEMVIGESVVVESPYKPDEYDQPLNKHNQSLFCESVHEKEIRETEQEIAQLERFLSDPNDDGGWILGDPYEALGSLRKKLTKLKEQNS